MVDREPFVPNPIAYDPFDSQADIRGRLKAIEDYLATTTADTQPTPEPAKPYAAMARGMAADFLEALGWSGYSQRIRNCSVNSRENTAIEALRAKLEALLEPVDRYTALLDANLSWGDSERLDRAGFTIIRTPDHD